MFNEEFRESLRSAFGEVRLEDGIGYFEANAIDDYVPSGSDAYMEYKEKDIRHNWEAAEASFRDWNSDFVNGSIYCFMNEKGIKYYLPVFMSNEIFHVVLDRIFDREDQKNSSDGITYTDGSPRHYYAHLMDSLSSRQFDCLLHFYRIRIDLEVLKAQIPYRCSCGKLHIPLIKANYSSAEKYAEESSSEVFNSHAALIRYRANKEIDEKLIY